MKSLSTRIVGLVVGVAVVAAIGATTSRDAQAVLPALPNTVQQWNKIAEDTVVGSGAFQGEGEIYMSYASLAVYDAVVAIQGGSSHTAPRSTHPRVRRWTRRRRGRVPDAERVLPFSCNPATGGGLATGTTPISTHRD